MDDECREEGMRLQKKQNINVISVVGPRVGDEVEGEENRVN